jgi:hypothetical protein
MGCETLVASVVANDEQAPNDKTSGQAAEQFEPNRFECNGARNEADKQSGVDQQQNKCTQSGAL